MNKRKLKMINTVFIAYPFTFLKNKFSTQPLMFFDIIKPKSKAYRPS